MYYLVWWDRNHLHEADILNFLYDPSTGTKIKGEGISNLYLVPVTEKNTETLYQLDKESYFSLYYPIAASRG